MAPLPPATPSRYRTPVWVGVFVLALALLVGLWFSSHFEQVPYERWETPGIDAIRNPNLAFERFQQRMGRPVQSGRDAMQLDDLPPGGVLILLPGRGRHMTPARIDALLGWVAAGGYLIVAPEAGGSPDPLLKHLGIRWAGEGKDTDAKADEDADPTAKHEDEPAPQKLDEDAYKHGIEVRIPAMQATDTAIESDAPTAPQPSAGLRMQPNYRGLRSQATPAWRASAAGADQVLHFDHVRGHVTVVCNLDSALTNYAIGKFDHAELIWSLQARYQPQGAVHLVKRLTSPGLLQWLVQHAWTALLAAAACLLLWLWRVMPRFGVIAATPPADRRALGEHLAAIGRYVWRAGGLDHWTALTRRHFQQRLALHHPAMAALSPEAQAEALARRVGATAHEGRQIAAALYGPVLTPLDFTHASRTLRALEQSLERGDLAREGGTALPRDDR